MLNGLGRLSACVASGVAFLALTGCGGGQPDDGYAGPPPAAYDRGASAPVLMGSTPSAPAADTGGLAGGPASGVMAPIPNPADLTRAERVRYYGHKYDHLPEPTGRKATGAAAAPAYPLIVRRRADGSLEISMRPIANPEDMSAAERRRVYGNRYAPRPTVGWSPRRLWRGEDAPKPVARPVAKPAAPARPVAVKPAPQPVAAAPAKPVVAAPAPRPVAPLATAPVVAAASIAPAVAPAPKATPGEQLSAAVRPEVMKGAVLTVPEGLAKGEESKVSLALPANLLDVIKREAAKLGLGKAARKAEVSANLTGEGYEISPAGAQTQALKAGEAARFDWTVKPGAGDKAPLKAEVDGTLTGDKTAKTTFSLASLEQAVAPVVENAKAAAKGFRFPALSLKSLAIPGMRPVTVPGVGEVQSEKLVGAGLALLALLLVIAMARNASAGRARAERRRKFRTMQDDGRSDLDAEPAHAPVSQPYVNPMIAAAGGAVAGVAVAHAVHPEHDDHHGHDAHGHHDAHAHAHDDHGHGAHAADGHHDDHGHGDHGHAADHGHGHEAHPVAHHPEPAHGHDDHGHDAHAHDDHGHAAAADGHDGHGHGDHGHAADHGHGHEAHPVAHHPEPAHGHDDHGHEAHAHGDHGHGAAAADGHGHDDHGHGQHAPAADDHHREPAHA